MIQEPLSGRGVSSCFSQAPQAVLRNFPTQSPVGSARVTELQYFTVPEGREEPGGGHSNRHSFTLQVFCKSRVSRTTLLHSGPCTLTWSLGKPRHKERWLWPTSCSSWDHNSKILEKSSQNQFAQENVSITIRLPVDRWAPFRPLCQLKKCYRHCAWQRRGHQSQARSSHSPKVKQASHESPRIQSQTIRLHSVPLATWSITIIISIIITITIIRGKAQLILTKLLPGAQPTDEFFKCHA